MKIWKYIVGLFLIVWGGGILLGLNIWGIFWPVVLILLGLKVLYGGEWSCHYHHRRDKEERRRQRRERRGEKWASSEDRIDEEIIMGAINKKYTSEKFAGGRISLILGGGEIDLTEAKLAEKETELEVTTVLGGLQIIVPEDMEVITEGTGVLGGFDNRTNGKGKILRISGSVVLGGVEIHN